MKRRLVLPAPLPAPATERELWLRAQALCGHTVGTLCRALDVALPARPAAAKGFVGQLVELALGADRDAKERPDFVRLGIELKTVPIKVVRQSAQSMLMPQESTFVCSIAPPTSHLESFASSRLRRRLAHVLLLPVMAAKVAPLADRKFYPPRLWRPSPLQWRLLQADWEDLMGAVAAGFGMGIGGSEGSVLQIRPKAAHARVRALGQLPDGPGDVLPLGFYLRARFLAEVLAA